MPVVGFVSIIITFMVCNILLCGKGGCSGPAEYGPRKEKWKRTKWTRGTNQIKPYHIKKGFLQKKEWHFISVKNYSVTPFLLDRPCCQHFSYWCARCWYIFFCSPSYFMANWILNYEYIPLQFSKTEPVFKTISFDVKYSYFAKGSGHYSIYVISTFQSYLAKFNLKTSGHPVWNTVSSFRQLP